MGFVALQTLAASLFVPGSGPALFALGGVMMVRLAPSLLLGPIAGVLADRYDRRKLIVFTDVVRFALYIAIALSRDLVALFALTFVVECLALLFVAAKDSSLPAIVDRRELTEANQLNLLVTYGTLPLGAVAATAMLAVTGLLARAGIEADPSRAALLVDAVTYLVSAVLMSRLSLPLSKTRPKAEEQPGFLAELREGIAFIRDEPLIRALITGVVGVFFGAGIVVALGPEFVSAELGRPRGNWFTLMTAVGVGLVIGLAVTGLANRRIEKERLFPICLAATGGIASVMALLPNFSLTLLFAVFLGMAAGLSFVQAYTLLHEHTLEETRARTFAALYMGSRVSLFAALGLGPFVAGTVRTVGVLIAGRFQSLPGIRATMLFGGLVALFFGVIATRGMYRALREQPERPVRLPTGGARRERERGLFIVFEGVEGSGKSTQVRALAATLETEGWQVLTTREPGGPPIAERLRAVLLDPSSGHMEGRTEALLLAAARAEHVEKVVRPALEGGTIVLCDRYIDSSLVYQGHARGLGEDEIAEINRWAVGGLLPDVVVLLDLDPEEGLRRAGARLAGQGPPDRLEREGIAFHRRVAEGYQRLARADRSRFLVVDASADEATVAHDIRVGLRRWLAGPTAPAAMSSSQQDSG